MVVDISDPSSLTLVGSYDTDGYSYEVYIAGSYAYVADYYYGAVILEWDIVPETETSTETETETVTETETETVTETETTTEAMTETETETETQTETVTASETSTDTPTTEAYVGWLPLLSLIAVPLVRRHTKGKKGSKQT